MTVCSIVVTGIRAAEIEAANHASFYGIWGNAPGCIPGRIAAHDAVREYLAGMDYYSFNILGAKTISTDGTKTSYKASIDFSVEC